METDLQDYPWDISHDYTEGPVIFIDLGDESVTLTQSDIDAFHRALQETRDED